MYPVLNRLMHRFLARRHFWRHAGFSELAELYASRVIRTSAVSMVSIFVAVYMYQNGYTVLFIMSFFVAYFLYRGISAIPATYIISRLGPKHGTLISNLMYVPALLALAFLPEFGWPMLVLYTLFQAFSMSLYNISYHVDFSKVKHADHAGKEIGFTQMMDLIGVMLSPLLGGVAAYLFGPQVVIIAATVLFALAALPLFFSPEPVGVHQKVDFRTLLQRYTPGHFIAYIGIGSNHAASVFTWPLFLVLVIFTTGTDVVYAQIGAVTSVAVLAGFVIIHIYGQLIDSARGRKLLEYSAIGYSVLHLSRLAVVSPVGVVAFNVAREAAMTGYNMPFTQGMLDTSDSVEDERIAYLSWAELVSALGAAIVMLAGALGVWLLGDIVGLQAHYVAASLLGLLVLAQRFKIYR